MQKTLKRLKLIDYLSSNLKISKIDFINNLQLITENGNPDGFTSPFSLFNKSNKEYIGQIKSDSFKIKRKRKLFDTQFNISIATSSMTENNNHLIIETEISGFTLIMKILFGFIFVFYSIAIIGICLTADKFLMIALPFIIIHAALFCLFPYLIMKRSVQRLKYDLEREFYFLTKID